MAESQPVIMPKFGQLILLNRVKTQNNTELNKDNAIQNPLFANFIPPKTGLNENIFG